MTSFPVGNNTSLSRKPCIPDKSYSGTLSGSHDRSFTIRHEKLPEAPPSGEITMTSYPVSNKTSLSRKPSIPNKVTMERYQEVMIALSQSVMKNRVKRPLAAKLR